MFCICLQVNNSKDLRVLLKFGLMSNNNISSIKKINRLLQEGAMNQSSAYKPAAVPKDMSTNDTAKGAAPWPT